MRARRDGKVPTGKIPPLSYLLSIARRTGNLIGADPNPVSYEQAQKLM